MSVHSEQTSKNENHAEKQDQETLPEKVNAVMSTHLPQIFPLVLNDAFKSRISKSPSETTASVEESEGNETCQNCFHYLPNSEIYLV